MKLYDLYTPNVWELVLLLANVIIALIYFIAKKDKFSDKSIQYITWAYIVIIGIVSAFRPIGKEGYSDSLMYIEWFEYAKLHKVPIHYKDIGFDFYQLMLSFVTNTRGFFVCTTIFFLLMLIAVGKKINRKYYFLIVPLFLGTEMYFGIMNVLIRNGLAMLLFLLAFFSKNTYKQIVGFAMSVLFHKSLIIVVFFYYLIRWTKIPFRYLLAIWGLLIPFTLIFKNHWFYLLEGFSFDDRFNYLFETTVSSGYYYPTGFRWDFLILSLIVVVYGCYHIYFQGYRNKAYSRLFQLFLVVNSFWIIIMYANHTFRFFILSWFLVPLILGMPLLDSSCFSKKKYNYYQLVIVLTTFSVFMYFKRLFF